MVKAELIKRSPLRIMEKSTHGGVAAGNLGIIASARGVGKTACLVHIATDQLLQGKHVIHVSFAGRIDHIMTWYETIFGELAKQKKLDSATEIHDDLVKNRVIMNFSQDGVSIDQLKKSLKAMIGDGHFNAETIVVDGYDFSKGKPEFVSALKAFAKEMNLSVWMTADVTATTEKNGVPADLAAYVADTCVMITLQSHTDHIALRLVKDHDSFVGEEMNLRLDPKTLLIDESK